MTYESVSQFLVLLLALLLGAFFGCLLRRWTRSSAPETIAALPEETGSQVSPGRETFKTDDPPAAEPVAAVAVAVVEVEVEEMPIPKPVQARGLDAAIGGRADDLKTISGIGPKLEITLNGLGIFHFEQIAGWSAEDIIEVDDLLSFKGRIERDDWIAQAKKLMME